MHAVFLSNTYSYNAFFQSVFRITLSNNKDKKPGSKGDADFFKLTTAQATIQHSLEKKWLQEYLKFLEKEEEKKREQERKWEEEKWEQLRRKKEKEKASVKVKAGITERSDLINFCRNNFGKTLCAL